MTKGQIAAAFTGIALAASMAGCGMAERFGAQVTGYTTICVKETGVQYVQFTSGAAPLIDLNGKPVPCK